jgi:hypothetical protein
MTVGYRWVQAMVRNKAARLDPPEIYNWRVFALAAAVRPGRHTPLALLILVMASLTMRCASTGMFRRHAFRHGYGHHRRRAQPARLQEVS